MESRECEQQTGMQGLWWIGATILSLVAFAANSIICRLALRKR